MELSSYEVRAREEVDAYFRTPEEGMLARVSRGLFRPVEALSERLIPDRVLEAAGAGVEAALRGLAKVSDQTVEVDGILASIRRRAEVDGLGDLNRLDLSLLDEVAGEVVSNHKTIGALEGAGCGLGGAALLAADIPLLFGVCLRTVRQVGACYGVDPWLAGEDVIAFKVFELACGGTRDRYGELLQLDALRDEFDGLEPQKRAEKAAVLAGLFASREAIKRIVSVMLTRKILQTVPLAGALVGAGFNYLFVSDVAETARQVYRRRFLVAKGGREWV